MPRLQRNDLHVILPIIAYSSDRNLPVDITHSLDHICISINGVGQMTMLAVILFSLATMTVSYVLARAIGRVSQ